MGQIVGSAAKPKRCNKNKLSQLGTPAAGEYILVSSDNSMTANGQGNFDCYIVGDGITAATALELHEIDKGLESLYLAVNGGNVDKTSQYNLNQTRKNNTVGVIASAAVTESNWAYILVPAKQGDVFIITGEGGSSTRAWSELDASEKVLVTSAASLTCNNLQLTISNANTAYLLCNTKTTVPYGLIAPVERSVAYLSDLTEIEEDITAISEMVEQKVDKKAGQNLVDPSLSIYGYSVNQNTGVLFEHANHWTTGFIPVVAGTTYYENPDYQYNSDRHCFYKADKTYLSGAASETRTFTAPTNAAYLRVSYPASSGVGFQISTENIPFKAYTPIGGYAIENLGAESVGAAELKDDIDYFALMEVGAVEYGKNLFNKNSPDIMVGVYFAGSRATNASYTITHPIKVTAGSSYVISKNGTASSANYIAFLANYADTTSISYVSNQSTFTVPSGANYAVISYANGYWTPDILQVEAGTTPTSYEAYGNKAAITLGANSVKADSIQDKSVAIEKTAFSIKDGVTDNILDPSNLTIDATKYIRTDNGNIGTWSEGGYGGYTDYITIDERGLYCNFTQERGISGGAYYNENKAYISGFTTKSIPYVSNAKYVRITIDPSVTDKIVSRGVTPVPYVAYNGLKDVISPDVLPSSIMGNEKEIPISLPDNITAVVGDTLQVFFRGCIQAVNPNDYNIFMQCGKGKQFKRYFEYTPSSADVGTATFKINIKDDFGKILGNKSCTLTTSASPSSPSSNINVLCIGDSITANGWWPSEAYRRLTGSGGTPEGKELSNIAFVGSQTLNGASYLGKSGWGWSDYTTAGRPAFRFTIGTSAAVNVGNVYTTSGYTYTVIEVSDNGTILCSTSSASNTPSETGTLTLSSGSGDASVAYTAVSADSQNPFWDYDNNEMTFESYVDTYCGGTIDVVYVMLGINGITPWKTDFTNTLAYVKTFADTLHTEYPNCKLKIMGAVCPSMELMMPVYGANGGYGDVYGIIVSVLNMNSAYQAFANDPDYSGWVEFVNVSSQIDSDYNMSPSAKAVNTRNSSVTELFDNNGVHPSTGGCYQIADVVFRNFVKEFCQ